MSPSTRHVSLGTRGERLTTRKRIGHPLWAGWNGAHVSKRYNNNLFFFELGRRKWNALSNGRCWCWWGGVWPTYQIQRGGGSALLWMLPMPMTTWKKEHQSCPRTWWTLSKPRPFDQPCCFAIGINILKIKNINLYYFFIWRGPFFQFFVKEKG